MLQKSVLYEPGHEKMCLMSYANNKGADHPRSLISVFIVRCLDSIISLDSIAEVSIVRCLDSIISLDSIAEVSRL